MTISQERLDIYHSDEIGQAVESNGYDPNYDPNANFTAWERWQMSGDTFTGRFINSTLRGLDALTELKASRDPCEEFFGRQSRTGSERLRRITEGIAHWTTRELSPNRISLNVGHVAAKAETKLVASVRKLRNSQ